jgi:hypothetical protein
LSEASSGTSAASTVPARTRAIAASASLARVAVTDGTPFTMAAVSPVTATFVVGGLAAAIPPHTTPPSAMSSRMRLETTNARLRSFDPISRSATSHTLCAVLGAAGAVDAVRAPVVTVLTG